jgi:hypothetical protein
MRICRNRLERARRVAALIEGAEGPHSEQGLFQGADEALGTAAALRRSREGGRIHDAAEGGFLLEGVGHGLAAVVVADRQARAMSCANAPTCRHPPPGGSAPAPRSVSHGRRREPRGKPTREGASRPYSRISRETRRSEVRILAIATGPRARGSPRRGRGCRRARSGSLRPAPRLASAPRDLAGAAGRPTVGSGGGRPWAARELRRT